MLLSRTARRRAKVWAVSTASATALAAVAVTNVQAQEVAAATIDSVVVTGSRITRDGYEAPTPVSVLGADELNALNTVNVADAVNVLPAFSGSASPRSANGNLSTGATGVSQLNLRGMGTNRTLVLLDGKRYINAALTSGNSAPDINSFPNALIERVDVVTGGASAAYGSDALSGVVNFVIDHDFTGFKGEVQTGMTKYEDDKSISAQLSYGTPFADGRGHLLLSGEHTQSDGIDGTNDRPWARLPAAVIRNPAYAEGNGQPQYVVRRDVGLSSGTPGGIITTGALRGTYFGPNGQVLTGYDFGANVGNNFQEGGDWEYSRIENGIDIAGSVKRTVGYLRTSYDLTDNVNAYLEGQYSATSTTNTANPNRRLGNNTISIDNAFLPESLRQQLLDAGQTSFRMGSTNADMGRFKGDYSRSVYRVAGGLDGTFGAWGTDWTWNTYVQHSETDLKPRTYNNGITPNYLKALDSVMVNGAPTCRVNADADPANDDAACVAYNPFGIGVNDRAALDYVMGVSVRNETLEQDVAAVNMSGEPFNSWAGPVSLAVGAEHRIEKVSGWASERDEATQFFAGNYKASHGKFHVTEGYVETLVPLARDLKFAQEFDLNAAVRATDYSTSGYVTTWKGGLTWRPIEDLRFRFTRSRDIRAPNLGELFTAGQTGSGTFLVDKLRQNPDGSYETNPNGYSLTRGNPDLKPEEADTTGFGVVMAPRFLPGFQMAIDYYNIDVTGSVQAPGAQKVIDLCAAGNATLCNSLLRDDQGRLFMVITQPQNLIGQQASGIDVETSYRFPMSSLVSALSGDMVIRAMASRVLKLETEDTDGTVYDGNGVVGDWAGISPYDGLTSPKLRGFLSVGYKGDAFTLTTIVRYTGPGVYANGFIECATDCPAPNPDGTPLPPTIENNDIAGMTTIDLSSSYKFESFELFGTIENLANKQPPIIGGNLTSAHWSGQGNADYDRIGRQYRMGVRFTF
ncbi:TonB-dependent receptor plug domain-containing protein [Steroidobacter agaridevorans]|uniref:TonB-dependent receptor plug domain-containing protein n=1 Tax=Steroidobacter agaridevorans TaxID=2695856 RepID=UPI0013223A88|nr:TonB-dependent receptor [Steroidobacter agaridevorans]GFE89857.1 TonB-dependent receptor [Steroidobacter agaridevorans]